uniref:Uncharacterized protein n=1 Tax=Angiostrongylus cantonensis TaxID=6313 RepID=A0A158P719_ANGCA
MPPESSTQPDVSVTTLADRMDFTILRPCVAYELLEMTFTADYRMLITLLDVISRAVVIHHGVPLLCRKFANNYALRSFLTRSVSISLTSENGNENHSVKMATVDEDVKPSQAELESQPFADRCCSCPLILSNSLISAGLWPFNE